jgi:precorrin-3B C17-methyltransferase
VGIGPGAYEELTIRAANTLVKCSLIVGYPVYVDLIRPYYPDKDYYVTPMRGEADRCRYALEQAESGWITAVVCSGDAGIYGMAGLVYQLRGEKSAPDIEVIGGLTAAISGAALLGAPLTHDFAVISLSDLLTDWTTIENRLEAAAKTGMSIVLYNPSAKKRADYLKRACDIIAPYVEDHRICGITRCIARADESFRVLSFGALKSVQADMFTTVFIGNPDTRCIGGKMVTPRGYRDV